MIFVVPAAGIFCPEDVCISNKLGCGRISGFEGKPYDHAAGNMLASNRLLHRAMSAVLQQKKR